MRITFVLPFGGGRPVGGLKVVYEYANQLVKRGHAVTLVHSADISFTSNKLHGLRNIAKFLYYLLTRKYLPDAWFKLDQSVKVKWVPSFSKIFAPRGDAVVATAWRTAEAVSNYPSSCGDKFYLIQHFEDWDADKDKVLATWRLSLKKIVISKWLLDMANAMNEYATLVHNGLDFRAFGVDVKPEARNPATVMMLAHEHQWKGTKDGLAALEIVRKSYPDLQLILFGLKQPRLSDYQSNWIKFIRAPSGLRLRSLYNESAIFVAPSWSEGWGLTPCEAMLCGCAVAMTSANGHSEFGQDGENCLMSPPKDIDTLAENILQLIRNEDLRIHLASSAAMTLQEYTWDRAGVKFEETLSQGIR